MSGQNDDSFHAVSLFSNCGAGDIGFAQAGFKFDVMAELDPRRLDVALMNHPGAAGISGDLRMTLGAVIRAYRRKRQNEPPALLAACPPCQGMSSAQSARGAGSDPDVGTLDHRNLLVQVIASAVKELRPRILVVENVQAFLTRQVRHPITRAPVSAANFLIESVSDNYVVYPLSADLCDFGVPQSRRRSFLTFVRKDEAGVKIIQERNSAPYPRPSHATAARQPICLSAALRSFNLPPLDASCAETATSNIPMHMVPTWSKRIYEMVKAIPPNSGLSAWENSSCLQCGRQCVDRSQVRCECGSVLPRPIVHSKDGVVRLVTGFHSSYRRMDSSIPASTVTTASGRVGSDRTIHPWENRLLSPLECALLQTFPRSFKWGDALTKWGVTNVRAMIGEAVPPLFTRKHGELLVTVLNGVPSQNALHANDRRIVLAEAALKRARLSSQARANLLGAISDG